MSRTRKPCPGCGEVHPQRKADDICHKCRHKLDVLLPALHERVRSERGDRQPFIHTTTWHWNPQFYGPYDFEQRHDMGETLAKAFGDLVEIVGERPEPGRFEGPPLLDVAQLRTHIAYHNSYSRGPDEIILLYPEQRVVLHRLFATIEQALTSVFAEGQRQGKQIVQQMLAGEMSMKEINDMVIGEG